MSNPRRYVASAAGLAAFALMAALGAGDATVGFYAAILRLWGMEPFAVPFVDFAGYLSSLQCTRLGIDVIAGNPCDPLARQFNYGPLWLDLTFLPLYPPHRAAGGVILGLVFLASLSLLPPPRRGWPVAATVLAGLSTAVVFAVERGNPDILIFLLTLAVVALLRRAGPARALAYALVWFAAGLKLYPAVLLALALRERLARFWLVTGVSVALLGVYLLRYHEALARILPLVPVGNYDSDLFAAKNLPMRLGRFTEVALAPAAYAVPAAVLVGGAILAALLARMLRQARRLLRHQDFAPALSALAEPTWLCLVAGSLLVAGCFFAGQNVAYRAILLLFTLPGLLVLGAAEAPFVRRLGRRAAWVMVFLLWEGAIRLGLAGALAVLGVEPGAAFLIRLFYWVFREMLWWWAVGIMLAVIIHFAWTSPVRRALWGEPEPRR